MNRIRSQSGSISAGGMLFLLALTAASYIGIKMGMPLIRYTQVQELFRNQVARLKVAGEEEVRKETYKKLEEMGVELVVPDYEYEGLRIIREKGKPAVIEGIYTAEVDFIGGYSYTYTFHLRKEAGS